MYRYLFALATLFLAQPAFAQVPDTVFLEKLTWEEVRDAVTAGKTTIIIPTGGTEQNGPHMALGKHNVRIAANAETIARRLGNALVAPVVAYTPEGGIDPPTGHMRFPGTISIPDPVFRQVLEYAARSLKQHGFRDIVFIGDSGPNQAGQNAVAATLNAEDIPISEAVREAYPAEALSLACAGGEDYQLVLTATSGVIDALSELHPGELSRIGRITEGPPGAVRLLDKDGAEITVSSAGWDHLRAGGPPPS